MQGEDSGGWSSDTQLGGYGENPLQWRRQGPDRRPPLRAVLGHDFADDLRFAGELEVEHALAGEGKPGEVEVEQAFIEYDFAPTPRRARACFSSPSVNSTKPTSRRLSSVSSVTTSRRISPDHLVGGRPRRRRRARQRAVVGPVRPFGSQGQGRLQDPRWAEESRGGAGEGFRVHGRLRWTGMPGVAVSATGQYQSDVTQGDTGLSAGGVSATLVEGNIDIRRGMFGLRALPRAGASTAPRRRRSAAMSSGAGSSNPRCVSTWAAPNSACSRVTA